MKVLFDHPNPFALAHGGFQILIEQTKSALEGVGVQVEWLRWWDMDQSGDLIHYFGRPHATYIRQAQSKGMKVVLAELLTGLGSRTRTARTAQKLLIEAAKKCLPPSFTARLAWESYQLADACIARTSIEANLMISMFSAPPERVRVIADGVEREFLESKPAPRGPWLVCTATLTERKRVLELAQSAVTACTPVWIIGKPYSEGDPYAQSFLKLAKANPDHVRYEGAITSRAILSQIYREARGFVLLSTMETLSLSALEGAACECPLLLSDLPWARCTFGTQASYCPIVGTAETARQLKAFYDRAPHLPPPSKPKSWPEIAGELKALYQLLLAK